jgi:hypothetical protein
MLMVGVDAVEVARLGRVSGQAFGLARTRLRNELQVVRAVARRREITAHAPTLEASSSVRSLRACHRPRQRALSG